MRFSKASLVAASLAFSSSGLFAQAVTGVQLYWNGNQSGYQVKYDATTNLPYVADAAGNPVTTAVPTAPAFVFEGAGGSGVIDSTTANWQDVAGTVAQSLALVNNTNRDQSSAIFGGTGGVVRVASTNMPARWLFQSGGYEVLPTNEGASYTPIRYKTITLSSGAGTLTLHDAFNGIISGERDRSYKGDKIVFYSDTSGAISYVTGAVDFVKDGRGTLQYGGQFQGFSQYPSLEYGLHGVHVANTYTPGVKGAGSLIPSLDLGVRARYEAITGRADDVLNVTVFDFIFDTGAGAGGGTVTVNNGALELAGSMLNSWYQGTGSIASSADSAQDHLYSVAHMAGASRVVINNGAEIRFNNSPLNVSKGLHPDIGGGSRVETLRYNYLNNPMAGLGHDQVDARINTGFDRTYRIDLHVDAPVGEYVITKLANNLTLGADVTLAAEIRTLAGFNLNGAVLLPGTVLAQGTVLPAGTIVPTGTDLPTNDPVLTAALAAPAGASTFIGQRYASDAERAATKGSVGILRGAGDVYKTGKGTLTILNTAEAGLGRFVAGGGTVVLAGPDGNTVANMMSFNLAGTVAGVIGQSASQAGYVSRYRDALVKADSSAYYFKQQFFPSPEDATVRLESNQTITNLQADFAFDSTGATVAAAIQSAYVTDNTDEPMVVSTGAGSAIDLNGKVLTLNQRRVGVYEGSIINGGDTGRVIKTGAATLVLGLAVSDFKYLEVKEGNLVANVQSLGQGEVALTGGTLVVLQLNTGTLIPTISGSSSLVFASQESVNGMQLNATGAAGVVRMGTVQSSFTGDVTVRDGVRLELSSGAKNALASAKSVTLAGGASNRESALAIIDGVQVLNNLTSDAVSRLDLGSGMAVLRQDGETALLGVVSGAGNLVKANSGSTLTLANAKNTYSGATAVTGGTLAVSAANGIAKSSGLILSGDGKFESQGANQTIGALFGTSDTMVNLNGGTLTVGTSAERAVLLGTTLKGGSPFVGEYLGTESLATIGGQSYAAARFDTALINEVTLAGATRTGVALNTAKVIKLASALYDPVGNLIGYGISDADADSLAFAGNILGAGGLIKQGPETLTLTGLNTFSGKTSVLGGTLRVDEDALVNSGATSANAIEVSSGATLAVNATKTALFDKYVTGAGDFAKYGADTLTLGDHVTLTGGIRVEEGALAMPVSGTYSGAVFINSGATLSLTQTADVATFSGSLTGSGTLSKAGAGTTLKLANILGFDGDLLVTGGTVESNGFADGVTTVDASTDPHATYSVVATAPLYLSAGNRLAGGGLVTITGAPLTISAIQDTFTGTLRGTGVTITGTVDNVIQNATLDLVGGTFAAGATTQTLSGLSGDLSSKITLAGVTQLDGSVLGGTLIIASDADTTYAGTFNGNGNLIKKGAGTTLTLSTYNNTHWTGWTTVDEGTLVATPDSLGDSKVTVNALGTLALYNPDPNNALTYLNPISGSGVIGKTGEGVVALGVDSGAFTGTVSVSQGELRAVAGKIGGRVFPSVKVATGGVYAVVMSATNTAGGVLLHDSSSATDKVADADSIGGMAQHGSLAVEGAYTLKLTNGQSYTGNTLLRTGATLDLTDASMVAGGVTALNGLGGEASTKVTVGTGSLLITQNVEGTFLGTFTSPVALTVAGTEKLALGDADTTDDTLANVTGITVQGKLVLDAAATASVLLQGGTLYFDTSTNSQVFAGTVTGAGAVMKTGSGDMDAVADTASFSHDGTLGVDQGKLSVDAGALGANITGLITEGAGTLALSVDSGATASLSKPILGSGKLEKSGAGRLNLGTAGSLYTVGSTGDFTVSAGTLGGYFRTSGDLIVAAGATLAPGFSPGVVTVDGDFELQSGATLEVEINGTTADKVVVNGVATLAGNLLVKQDSTAGSTKAARGQSFIILTATDGVAGTFANADANGIVQLAPADIAATGIARVRLAESAVLAGDPTRKVTMTTVTALNATPGFTPHEGIDGLIAIIDRGTALGGLPETVLAAVDDVSSAENLSSSVNALSPLGLGSMYAMGRDTSLRHEDRIRERLEQRRYDHGGYSPYEWEAFVVGSTGMGDNKVETDTPTFDTRTYGGLVGLDHKLASGTVVGGAAGYDNGTATLHQGAGKVEMNRVRATGFLSTKVTNRWFVDAGLSAGFGDYTTQRNTVTGRATGSTTGVDVGANVFTGTIVVLRDDLHLTPFAGLSYAHHEFSGFTENAANPAALKVDGWSNDSLRATLGTGLGWWVPAGDWKWKLGMDVSYNHELLDTESDIDSAFVSGGAKFGTTAAALPADSISVGPNAALHFDEDNSLSAGVNFEYGFDGRTYTGFNVAFRRRF